MKIVIKCFILQLFLIAISLNVLQAQQTNGFLGVENYPERSVSDSLIRLARSRSDTIGIKALLKVASIYWNTRASNIHYVDSMIYYATLAKKISRVRKYTYGITESNLLICKANLESGNLAGAKYVLGEVWGEERVRLMLSVAEHYVFLPGEEPGNLAIALPYIRSAIALSDSLKSQHWKIESQIVKAKYHFANGEVKEGENAFISVASYYHSIGDKAEEARWWNDLAKYMPDNKALYSDEMSFYTKALNLYKELNNYDAISEVYTDMSYISQVEDQLDISIHCSLKAIVLRKKYNPKKLQQNYRLLADTYRLKGDLQKALYYALLTLDNLKTYNYKPQWAKTYKALGDIYAALNEPAKSTFYYKLSFANPDANSARGILYITMKSYVDGLIALHKADQGLSFMRSFTNNNPAMFYSDREILASALAACYNEKGKYAIAEKYYLEMIKMDEANRKDRTRQITNLRFISSPDAYYTVGKFYVDRGEFGKAADFITRAAGFSGVLPVLEQKISTLQFKLDSANGNFSQSIKAYKRSAFIKDSLQTAQNNRELYRLKVQFETAQKDESIKLLQKESELQKKKLEKSKQLKLFTLSGIVMLMLLLGVTLNRYRLKQRNNKLLLSQKDLISKKNVSLQQLIKEKEWLLREMHHRVKNNLQLITSLLNSQLQSVTDNNVIDALHESKNRIQAMSMVHQRLYMNDSSTRISMSTYLIDLLDHLKESFPLNNRVVFKHTTLQLKQIDIGKAVPLGLILNEGITNSIKHAFPEARTGYVEISMKMISETQCRLRIIDNGIGLREGFDLNKDKSLGLQLIEGLSEDIAGKFSITSTKGTTIEIIFNT